MAEAPRPQRRRLLPRSVRRGLLGFLAAFVVLYLVAPQIAGARKALHLLGQVNLAYVGLGAALEAGAIVAYALLTRSVLPKGSPPLATLLRINLSTLAVSHVVPGGTAGGTGLGYRLLTEAGVEPADAGFALATESLGSAVVLNVVLWLALLVSIPLRGFNPLYATAALVGVVLFAAFAALVALLTRGQARAEAVLAALARRLPFLDEATVTRVVRRLAERLAELARDRPLLRRAIAWAAANWLLDAASLWVFLVAFGRLVDPDALLVAYGLANVLAAIPVTPGGLGVVEGVATSVLVGFHTPRGVAILAVLGWRLVNFWLPIPAGAFAYLSLRLEPGAGRARRAEELARLAEEAARAAHGAHPPPPSPAS
jgi:uncharacterized protein (TIRG00374 family)